MAHIEGIDEKLSEVKEDIKCKMEEMTSKIEFNQKSNAACIADIENRYAASIVQDHLSLQGLDARLTEKIDSSIQMLVDKQDTVLRRLEEGLAQQNNDVSFFKNDAADLIEKVSEVSEKILDFEKNKRNNLIIYGIPNDPRETPSTLDDKVKFKHKTLNSVSQGMSIF